MPARVEYRNAAASVTSDATGLTAAAASPVAPFMAGLQSAGLLTGKVLVGSLLIAVCAHLSIPLWFTPVPVTLQPFAVLLLGLLMSPRLAFATMVAYLAEGAMGLPVFTPHGLGGLAQLLGPTGGYLFSYPVVAPLVSALWRRGAASFSRGLWIAGACSLVTLFMGAVWLGVLTHAGASTILNHAVLPFLPGDILKVAGAAAIAAGWARIRRQQA